MKAKFVRGQDPKDAMQIGHWGIKRALLSSPVELDEITGDAHRSWFENDIPDAFLDDLEYESSDPLAFMDYLGFDDDSYMENELPEWVDDDDFRKDWKAVGSYKNEKRKSGGGNVHWQEGVLPDGTKVFQYLDGMGSGYIAHKDWLK